MKVNFYATFRPLVGGKTVALALPEGSTVRQFILALVEAYPLLDQQLIDEQGNLFPHIHVFVNGRDAPYLPEALQTVLTNSDTIDIFPPVGGG